MILTCTSCQKQTVFTHELQGPYYFVCPKCNTFHHYGKSNVLQESQVINYEPFDNILELNLGDVYSHNGSLYHIISICKRKSIDDTWIEYGAYNGSHFIFISSSINKSKDTYILSEYNLPSDFNIAEAKKKTIRKYRSSFSYDYMSTSKVLYSEGLMLTNPLSKSIYYPFNNIVPDETTFLSIEETDGEFSAFYGKVVTHYELYRRFRGEKFNIEKIKRNLYSRFINLFAYSGIAFLLLFVCFNKEGLFEKTVINFADATIDNENSASYKVIIIPIDLSDVRTTQLNIEGIISSTTHSELNLKLINLDEKEVVYNYNVLLKSNLINNASHIKALTKKVKPGRYELWVSTHSSPNINTRFEADVDLKITSGQIVKYYPLIISLICLSILLFIILESEFSNIKPSGRYTIKDLIKTNHYMYFITYCFIIVAYCSYEIYLQKSLETSNSYLEDADYTGRRYHYIHYTSSSHK